MKIDVDGERSRQRLPFARKLLHKCRLADIPTKAVDFDGFRASVRVGDEEVWDRARIEAPVGAVATATLSDKVRWIVAEHVWGSAVGHDFTVCYTDDPECATPSTPLLTQHAKSGQRRSYPQLGLVTNEVLKPRWVVSTIEGGIPQRSRIAYVAHAYGTMKPADPLTPYSGNSHVAPSNLIWPCAGVPSVLTTPFSSDVAATNNEFVASAEAFIDLARSRPASALYTSDLAQFVGTHPDTDTSTMTIYHADVPHTVRGYDPQYVFFTVWLAADYEITTDPGRTRADALSLVVYFEPATQSWSYLPDTVTYTAQAVAQDQSGRLDMPFAALSGAPYNHTFGRVTFFDEQLGAPITWGVWDGYDTSDTSIGHYNWHDPIPADAGSNGDLVLETFYRANGAGIYAFPPGLTDPWVRPEYVQGANRWFLLYRQFEDGVSQRSTVHSIYIGSPTTSWTEIPLPNFETYHVQPTWMNVGSGDLTLEMSAVAKDVEGQLRFWVYRDFWGDLQPAGWQKAAVITDTEIEADPAAAMWSVSLYGKQIDSRYGEGGAGVSPMPMTPVPG